MAATDWTAIEDGVRSWVKYASGMSDGQIIFSEQANEGASGAARPSGMPFLTIRMGDISPLGAVDEVEELTDLNRPAGMEIEERVGGMREFSVSIQAFTGAATNTLNAARALLSRVQTGLTLPSVAGVFNALNISCFDRGHVQNISALLGNRFEGRASLECRFYVRETISEYTGYIKTVQKTSFMGPPDSGTQAEIDI